MFASILAVSAMAFLWLHLYQYRRSKLSSIRAPIRPILQLRRCTPTRADSSQPTSRATPARARTTGETASQTRSAFFLSRHARTRSVDFLGGVRPQVGHFLDGAAAFHSPTKRLPLGTQRISLSLSSIPPTLPPLETGCKGLAAVFCPVRIYAVPAPPPRETGGRQPYRLRAAQAERHLRPVPRPIRRHPINLRLHPVARRKTLPGHLCYTTTQRPASLRWVARGNQPGIDLAAPAWPAGRSPAFPPRRGWKLACEETHIEPGRATQPLLPAGQLHGEPTSLPPAISKQNQTASPAPRAKPSSRPEDRTTYQYVNQFRI